MVCAACAVRSMASFSSAAEPLAVDRGIDCKPREQNDRDRMPGLAFADALHRLLVAYRPSRQTVIAQDAQISREHVGLRAVGLLAGPCLPFEEAVELLLAAVEFIEQMLAPQLLGQTVLAYSRTLGVLRSFSRRGRGIAGASRAAKNLGGQGGIEPPPRLRLVTGSQRITSGGFPSLAQ